MAKSPDWTMITMPYDLTVDTNKISDSCLPPRVLEITSNGSYNVIPYTRAAVNVDTTIPRCTLSITNNSSYNFTVQTVNNRGGQSTVQILAGKKGNVYGLMDANGGGIVNYCFTIRIFGNATIKGTSDQGSVNLGKVLADVVTVYGCMVTGNTEDIDIMTLVFTDN